MWAVVLLASSQQRKVVPKDASVSIGTTPREFKKPLFCTTLC